MDNNEPFAEDYKEPFAKLYDGDSDKPVILLAGGSFRIDCPKDDGERMVTFLNAAHEAAVRESVKKAVAPLRAELKRLDFVFNRERIGRNRKRSVNAKSIRNS